MYENACGQLQCSWLVVMMMSLSSVHVIMRVGVVLNIFRVKRIVNSQLMVLLSLISFTMMFLPKDGFNNNNSTF